MAANVEWSIPFLLKSPAGELEINAATDDRFLIVPSKSYMKVKQIRVSEDDVPQGDGGTPHESWRSLYETKLVLQYWIGDGPESSIPACGSDRQRMNDLLMIHLNALVRPSRAAADAGDTQLIWTPSGTDSSSDDRMLNRIKLVDEDPAVDDGEGAVEVSFTLHSPFPYAMDKTEIVSSSTTGFTVTNPGTADFYPVFKVHGATQDFLIANNTTGLQINYVSLDAAYDIASGHYAEVSTFDGTIFLDGSGRNLLPMFDVLDSDFWTLVPGPNEIEILADGATVDMLWQAAWF